MKPSASKRRSKRTESIELEEVTSLASASPNNTPSGSSESETSTTEKMSSKRKSGKKANESDGEYSDTADNKKRSNDKRRSTKKRLYTGKDSENQDSDSHKSSESDDEVETAQSPKKVKVAKAAIEKKPKRGKGKSGRKAKQVKGQNADVTNGNAVVPDNLDYEVEDIVDNRMKFGKLQYLIRWKGYGPQDDSWERADGLQCPDVIKRYKHRAKEEREAESNSDAKTEEYEVNRILEVHFRRDGSREFLVNWKGYSRQDNTWEHENNMKSPELIAQFMRRVEQAKEVTPRELRELRKPTNHYTANTFKVLGRRLSDRSKNKPRVNYFYDDQY